MLGVIDRRSKEGLPWKTAEALVRLAPSFDRTGNSDAVNAIARHSLDSLLVEEIDSQLARRPAAGVEAIELARLRVPVDQEQVASDAVHHRLQYTESCIGGDGGIHG